MLTSKLIKPRLRFSGSTLSVEMVNEHDTSLQQTAQDLITLLRDHRGKTQEAWEEIMATYEGNRIDYIFVRGLAKVLTVILQHIVAKMSAISFTKRAARYPSQGGFELKCETSRHLSWLVRNVRGKAPHPAPIFSSWLW